MKLQPKIAVVLPDSKLRGSASLLNGLTKYAHEHEWLLTFCLMNPNSTDDFPLDWPRLKSRHVDGIILQANFLKPPDLLRTWRIPMVSIAEDFRADGKMPSVVSNNQMVGRMAAEHLIGLGLKNLAYHGVQGRRYSDERRQGFIQAANEARLKVNSLSLPHLARGALWNERYESIKRWLKTLPLPIGLFATCDYRALIILSTCREIGLRVPEDVAVIGSDNDLMVCEFSTPTLTSVCVNAYRMGYEAARLLDQLMHGKPPLQNPVLIDPSEIVVRASTDLIYVEDPAVKKAIQFMRLHFFESFGIEKVAEAIGVSRRLLEMRFRAETKISPAKFLANLRLQKAMVLVNAHTHQSMEEIARICGFRKGKNLRAAFKRILSVSPNDFKPKSVTSGKTEKLSANSDRFEHLYQSISDSVPGYLDSCRSDQTVLLRCKLPNPSPISQRDYCSVARKSLKQEVNNFLMG